MNVEREKLITQRLLRKAMPRNRPGTNLVELLGVMAVIAIIGVIAFGGIVSAQEKARITSAKTSIAAYEDAFLTACITSPGIVGDRYKIVASGGTYNAKEGLKRVVQQMNYSLDDSLDLYWDDSLNCYVANGKDPWGGRYVLLNYPTAADGSFDYMDMSDPDNQACMALSVWCTGNSDMILGAKAVAVDSYGVGLLFKDGLGSGSYQGFDGQQNFTDSTLTFD